MLKRFLTVGIVASCLAIAGAAVPALAQSDYDYGPDRPVSSPADRGNGIDGNPGDAPAGGRDLPIRDNIADQARERAERIRQQAEQRQAQVLMDICERREQQLNQLIPSLSRQATSLLGTIDSVYSRVQQFYDTGQITVENYDELTASVDAAGEDAAAAVQALSDYGFNLNCSDPKTGDYLESFRIAASEAKEALKNYRAELVNLISALRAAAEEQQ